MTAYLIDDCPHCRRRDQSLRVIGADFRRRANGARGDTSTLVVGLACNSCEKPIAGEVTHRTASNPRQTQESLGEASNSNSDISLFNLAHKFVPTPAPREILPGLPENVERAFCQAENAFDSAEMEEPSAMSYRRAIERAIAYKHGDLTGDLIDKIRELARTNIIPAQMADWAHQVRIIGNNGAHDEAVSRPDLIAARAFADAFLRYLIVLPEMVAERRRETGTDTPSAGLGDQGAVTE
ncbi:MAG: DUF4145 domain-containing protein [Hoeflea sp.]|uniref:DUF4145 domain-containing protein n=1 Tax=Hoeflea sp. TaxID=1940281 RepID=UPI003EF35862